MIISLDLPDLLDPQSSALELKEAFLKRRGLDESWEEGHIRQLPSPFLFKDMDKAVERLAGAMKRQERLALVCDHDCDGQTACATLYRGLRDIFDYPQELIEVFIGHRTLEGYGLGAKLCQRILDAELIPQLIITADCGSNDEVSIGLLKAAGIDVIVTDHHQMQSPYGAPSAYAVVNPQRVDCDFPDKMMAGCAVAWMLLWGLKEHYAQIEPGASYASLAPLLDYVALGTLADCVSLKESWGNRALIRYGLWLIEQQNRPCWRVLSMSFDQAISSTFLAFKVIPLINADGRLGDALTGIDFLCSEDMVLAKRYLSTLIETNDYRKSLQFQQMILIQPHIHNHAPYHLVNLGVEGHHGIHGISAGRVMEQEGKIVIVFSRSGEQEGRPILSGSARAPKGYDVLLVLKKVAQTHPDLILRFGGHQQAAGLSLYESEWSAFERAWAEAYGQLYDQQAALGREIKLIVDFYAQSEFLLNRGTICTLYHSLEPFGQGFGAPLWAIRGVLVSCRALGSDKNHLEVHIQSSSSSELLKGMMFFQKRQDVVKQWLFKEVLAVGVVSFERFRQKDTISIHLQAFMEWTSLTGLYASQSELNFFSTSAPKERIKKQALEATF